MAGQPKKGIDYAGWNTHTFDDDLRIDTLIDSQGWLGWAIYFFLCQKAFATDGYYYRWSYDNAPSTARRMGGGVRSETVKETVNLCLRIGLFDKRLFDEEGILTSDFIQTRYMLAIEKRSAEGRKVKPEYWILKNDDTKAWIIIPSNSHFLPENSHSLPENATKESKVKESKLKESRVDEIRTELPTAVPIPPPPSPSPTPTQTTRQKLKITDSAYQHLCDIYPASIVNDYIERVYAYCVEKGKRYSDYAITVKKWIDQDAAKGKISTAKSSYDADEYMRLAMELDPSLL